MVDLRDGWLDEPLKPLLNRSRLRRWREHRLESRVLERARHILVTSRVWRDLLLQRYPSLENKCTILTNAMPIGEPESPDSARRHMSGRILTLLYTGRLGGSHSKRRVDDLMQPILEAHHSGTGRIDLLGDFDDFEKTDIREYASDFKAKHWEISLIESQPRDRVYALQREADGLLLLSASNAAIPAKLFEYLVSGRPILAISTVGSAVWQLGENIDQIFNYPLGQRQPGVVDAFLDACKSSTQFDPPSQFSDAHCRQIWERLFEN